MRIPPKNVCKRLNTPAPIIRAKKNSFRSAPMRVRGRLRDRKTGLCLRSMAFPPPLGAAYEARSRKEPRHEVDRPNSHADTEDYASERALGGAFAEGKHQAANDDCDQGESSGDGARKGCLQDLDCGVPRIF